MASLDPLAPPTAAEVVHHTLHDLFLNHRAPSPTRWLVANAEDLPNKLLRHIRAQEPALTGKADGSGHLLSGPAGEEIISLRRVAWIDGPKTNEALVSEQALGRDLKLTFAISAADGRTTEVNWRIPGVPFCTPWGTYVVGANQLLIANKLVQKPGVFPVNLEERAHPTPDGNGVLFHSPYASILQLSDRVVAIARTLTTTAQHQGQLAAPVTVPRAAWGEFDAALTPARLGSASDRLLQPTDFPQLSSAFAKAMRLADSDEKTFNLSFNRWVNDVARAPVEPDNWKSRWERLGHPKLAEAKYWNLANAGLADAVIVSVPNDEFIPFSSIARLRVQTGADLMAEMLAQKVNRVIERVVRDSRWGSGGPARQALAARWGQTSWSITQDILRAARSGTDRNNNTLANEKTPAETAMRVNMLIREGHIFGTPDDISEAQRRFDAPSSQYFLSAITMENAQVGNVLHLLPQTEIDPANGELIAPFAVVNRDQPGEFIRVRLNSERLEVLESALREQGTGLLMGRPGDLSATTVTVHHRTNPIARIPKAEVAAYFDAAPEDCLPLAIRMFPGMVDVEVSRHPMSLAFSAGASSCNGSGPDADFTADATAASCLLLNAGKAFGLPVGGVIEAVQRHGRLSEVQVRGDDGKLHCVQFPTDLSNAFSNAVGLTVAKPVGSRVEPGEFVLIPDQACVRNSVAAGIPGVFPSLPLRAAQFSLGEEDLLVVSSGLAASGRATVLKQANAVRISSDEGDIRLAIGQPGTLLLPGMTIGWRQTTDRQGVRNWQEILAGEDDRGIIANIFFVKDDKGRGGSVTLNDLARQAPLLPRQTADLLAAVAADFQPIADGWNPAVIEHLRGQGANPREHFESAHYYLWTAPTAGGEPVWEHRAVTLADLMAGPGNAAHDELVARLLHHPAAELIFGEFTGQTCTRNAFEDRLHFTQQLVHRMKEAAGHTITADLVPASTRSVVVALLRELPLGDGDKLTAGGTKGSTKVVHPQELPMHVHEGRFVPAELAYTMLGFFARSDYGNMKSTSEGPNARVVTSSVWSPERGLMEMPIVHGIYRALRQGESNPGTAASARGTPEREIQLERRGAGFSFDGQAQDGRAANRADHTLAADVRPALEVGYSGPRDHRTLVRNVDVGLMHERLEERFSVRPLPVLPSMRPSSGGNRSNPTREFAPAFDDRGMLHPG